MAWPPSIPRIRQQNQTRFTTAHPFTSHSSSHHHPLFHHHLFFFSQGQSCISLPRLGKTLSDNRAGWQRSISRGRNRGANPEEIWPPAANAWQGGGRQWTRNQISVRKGEKEPIFSLPSLAPLPFPSIFAAAKHSQSQYERRACFFPCFRNSASGRWWWGWHAPSQRSKKNMNLLCI